MPSSSLRDGSLQSESPANRRLWQYFTAFFQVRSFPLSLPAHINRVDGSIQYPRACVSPKDCAQLSRTEAERNTSTSVTVNPMTREPDIITPFASAKEGTDSVHQLP